MKKEYFESDIDPIILKRIIDAEIRKEEKRIRKPLKKTPVFGLTKEQKKKREASVRAKQARKNRR